MSRNQISSFAETDESI